VTARMREMSGDPRGYGGARLVELGHFTYFRRASTALRGPVLSGAFQVV
jgi:hypothetical protein